MRKYVFYEFKNAMSNFFALFFGVVFPIFMAIMFFNIYKDQAAGYETELANQFFVNFSLMIPLALVFISFASIFSQEIEKEITVRMQLFGYSIKKQMISKAIAQLLMLIMAFAIFALVVCLAIPVSAPSLYALSLYLINLIVFSFCLFLLAYSISLLTRRFSITYGITMTFYFAFMFLSGMMGMDLSKMSGAVQYASNLIPSAQMNRLFSVMWTNHAGNLAPLVQSQIFFFALTILLYLFTLWFNRRER